MRLQREQSFERSVRPIALIAIATDVIGPEFFASLLVEYGLGRSHRRNLAGEEAFLLSTRGALLAFERIFVLNLTADVVALGDHFRCVTHHHINAGLVLLERKVRIVIARRHRNAL